MRIHLENLYSFSEILCVLCFKKILLHLLIVRCLPFSMPIILCTIFLLLTT